MSAGVTCGLLVIDHLSTSIMLACASLASHMGTRFYEAFEVIIVSAVKRRLGG